MKQPLWSGFGTIFYNYILNIRRCTIVQMLKIYKYIANIKKRQPWTNAMYFVAVTTIRNKMLRKMMLYAIIFL